MSDDVTARARATVDGYFAALEAAEFERAVEHFTEDVFYSHPPYPEEGVDAPRHEVRGRRALLALFHHRGPRVSRHRIDRFVATEDTLMFGGEVFDGDGAPVLSFLSYGDLEPGTGRLRSYAAYVSIPAVGATLGPSEPT